jgi:hypothetical protein
MMKMDNQTMEIPQRQNYWLSTISIVFSLGLTAIPAYADQCMLIPKQQALAAMARLEPGDNIYSLCELCGEKQPQKIAVKTIELVNEPRTKLWQVKINNREIDLAYTYVRSQDFNDSRSRSTIENRPQINLSIIANCPATGIKPILSIK